MQRTRSQRSRRTYTPKGNPCDFSGPTKPAADIVYRPVKADYDFLATVLNFSETDILDNSNIDTQYFEACLQVPGWIDWFWEQMQGAMRTTIPLQLIRKGMQEAMKGEYRHWEAMAKVTGLIKPDKVDVPSDSVYKTMSGDERRRLAGLKIDKLKKRLSLSRAKEE